MKKTLLSLVAVSALLLSAQTSRGVISVTATPSSQSVAPGGSFNVSFTLSVTQATAPANVTGFDLYVTTSSANSGRFRITSTTPTGPFNGLGPTLPVNGDPLSTAAAANFVRNGVDLGYSSTTAQPTPLTNVSLETVTFSLANNVPAGTYTFQTSTTANAGGFFSDVSDSGGNVYEITSPGSFSITVVPEPSTWALLSVGACGALVFALRRQGFGVRSV